MFVFTQIRIAKYGSGMRTIELEYVCVQGPSQETHLPAF